MIRELNDSVDELVRRLAQTTLSQLLVRLIAALGALGALVLIAPWPLEWTATAWMVLGVAGVLTLWQSVHPDGEAGLVMLALVVAVAALGGFGSTALGAPGVLRTLGAALAMHMAHTGWALAALTSADGVIEAPALRMLGTRALMALGGAALAGLAVVLPLWALPGATWMLVPAAVALVMLTVMLVPRERR